MQKTKTISEVKALRDLLQAAEIPADLIAKTAGSGVDSVYKAIAGTRAGAPVMIAIYGLLRKRILGVPAEGS